MIKLGLVFVAILSLVMGVLLTWLDGPLTRADWLWLLAMISLLLTTFLRDNAELVHTRQALDQHLDQLSNIEELARQITEDLDLDHIIRNLLDMALRSTRADLAHLCLSIDDDRYRVLWRTRLDSGDQVQEGIYTIRNSVVGQVMRKGEAILLTDHSQYEHYVQPVVVDEVYHSSVAVPMRRGQQTFGVLVVEGHSPNAFSPENTHFLQNLADHATISIKNAAILDEREQQINTLTILREMSMAMLHDQPRDSLNESILRAGMILFDADEAALLNITPNAPLELTLQASLCSTAGHYVPMQVTLPLAQLQTSLSEYHATKKTRPYEDILTFTDESNRQILALPIRRRAILDQALVFVFAQPRNFQDHEWNTMDLFMVQMASQLEHLVLNDEIRHRRDNQAAILNATRDALLLFDEQHRLQEWNTTAAALVPEVVELYQGETLLQIFPQQNAAAQWIELANQFTQEPMTIHGREWQIQKGNSDEMHVILALVFPVQSQAQQVRGHVLILRDITEEKEIEAFRERVRQMVVHDLRGPLSSIVSAMTLAIEILEHPTEDEDIEQSIAPPLHISLESAHKMLGMIDTLNELPQITRISVHPEAAAASDIVQDAINSLSIMLQEASITPSVDIPDALEPLYVDVGLIQRVFLNLLQNAYKYTPAGTEIVIDARSAQQSGFVHFRVSDSGPGIPEDERERIFDEFVRIKGRKANKGGQGIGLGLNFCKLAVEAHGGQIQVEATGPLPGATFGFTLPQFARDESPMLRNR